MTYDDAVIAAKAGSAIRHPEMGKGWVLRWSTDGNLYAINPHTGSSYQSNPKGRDLERQDWTAG